QSFPCFYFLNGGLGGPEYGEQHLPVKQAIRQFAGNVSPYTNILRRCDIIDDSHQPHEASLQQLFESDSASLKIPECFILDVTEKFRVLSSPTKGSSRNTPQFGIHQRRLYKYQVITSQDEGG